MALAVAGVREPVELTWDDLMVPWWWRHNVKGGVLHFAYHDTLWSRGLAGSHSSPTNAKVSTLVLTSSKSQFSSTMLCLIRVHDVIIRQLYHNSYKPTKTGIPCVKEQFRRGSTHGGLNKTTYTFRRHKTFKCIFLAENFGISIQILPKFVYRGSS